MIHTLLGTALVACGAAALNQLLEREHDAQMRRTEDRPLPSGRLQPETVLLVRRVQFDGRADLPRVGGESADQFAWGGYARQLPFHLHAAETGHVVEHRRRRDSRSVAAADGLDGRARRTRGAGWALFAILFFWQIPHFLAIAWMYRDEYAKAGFVMLPVVDPDWRTHRRTRR